MEIKISNKKTETFYIDGKFIQKTFLKNGNKKPKRFITDIGRKYREERQEEIKKTKLFSLVFSKTNRKFLHLGSLPTGYNQATFTDIYKHMVIASKELKEKIYLFVIPDSSEIVEWNRKTFYKFPTRDDKYFVLWDCNLQPVFIISWDWREIYYLDYDFRNQFSNN